MADAAAARREARKRKILENSQNRLQIISGKSTNDSLRDSPIRSIVADHSHEIPEASDSCIIKKFLNNGLIVANEPELTGLLSQNHENYDTAAGDGELSSETAPFVLPTPLESPQPLPSRSPLTSPPPEHVPTQSFWEKSITYRYDIVWLSIMIQCLNCLPFVEFYETYFFLPVLIYIITKLWKFPVQSNSKLGSVLMILRGLASYRMQKVIFLTQCMSVIFGDICVYLFTTICIQSLLITLKDSFIT